jgi:hypothetical protein
VLDKEAGLSLQGKHFKLTGQVMQIQDADILPTDESQVTWTTRASRANVVVRARATAS